MSLLYSNSAIEYQRMPILHCREHISSQAPGALVTNKSVLTQMDKKGGTMEGKGSEGMMERRKEGMARVHA